MIRSRRGQRSGRSRGKRLRGVAWSGSPSRSAELVLQIVSRARHYRFFRSQEPGARNQGTSLTATSKAKIVLVQKEAEHKAKQAPNDRVRNGRDTDTRQEKDDCRENIEDHPD